MQGILILVLVGLFLITLFGVLAFFSVEHFNNLVYPNGFSFETKSGSPFMDQTSLIRIGSIRSKRHPIEIEQSYNWYNNP